MTDTIVFEPWIDEHTTAHPFEPVDGTFSRLAWLPTIGPSSWLVWGTLAGQLHHEPRVTWRLEDLALAHGLGHGAGRTSLVARTLERLTRFRLLADTGEAMLVRLGAPPLHHRQLDRLPAFVGELQRRTFGEPLRAAG